MRHQDIDIPEPCHADWDAMSPRTRGKFCFECRKTVHDLSAMTEDEANDFLQRTACEDVCISYEHDDAGTLRFVTPAPAPIVPLSRLRRPRKVAAAVVGAGVVAALAACAPHGEGPQMKIEETVAYESPTVVIPHGQLERPTPTPTPTPETVEDEPCDPQPVQVDRVRRVKGKMKVRRTAGRRVPKTRTVDPFF